jgi:hypothetical protein
MADNRFDGQTGPDLSVLSATADITPGTERPQQVSA